MEACVGSFVYKTVYSINYHYFIHNLLQEDVGTGFPPNTIPPLCQ